MNESCGPDLAVTRFVTAYSPSHVNPNEWEQIADVARAAAIASAPTVTMARRILPVLAGFGAWALREGYAITAPLLRDSELLDRYVEGGMGPAADSTRATRRSILRLVAMRLDPCPAPAPQAIAYRRVKPPYAEWEVHRYFAVALAQPTAARRWSSLAMLALGLGCGLDRPDLAWVRGIDVETNADVIRVNVVGGTRPRTVVAFDDYAELLLRCAHQTGENLLIGGHTLGRHNVTTPMLNRLSDDRAIPRVLPARLRSTWLVQHLERRTPLAVLLPAAGLRSSRSLDDLLAYTRPVDPDTATSMLRGTSG